MELISESPSLNSKSSGLIRREVTCSIIFSLSCFSLRSFKKTFYLSLHPFPLFSQEKCKDVEQEKDCEKRVFVRESL